MTTMTYVTRRHHIRREGMESIRRMQENEDTVRTGRDSGFYLSHELTLSDEALFDKFLEGSRSSFDALINRYKNPIGNFIFRYTGDRDEAEDLTQETFIRVFQKSVSFKRGTKFRPWIYTIARNVAIDALRKSKRERRFRQATIHADEKYGAAFMPQSIHGNPVEALDRKELEEVIQGNLLTMSDKYRTVLILCDIQGHSYEEAAEIMQTPIKTVSTRLHRARRKFAQKMRNYLRE